MRKKRINRRKLGDKEKMVFGRKTKKKEDPQEVEAGVTEAKVEKGAVKKEEEVKIPAELQESITDFKEKYSAMFVETDFNKPEVQQLNLLFGIFAELKTLNKKMDQALKEE